MFWTPGDGIGALYGTGGPACCWPFAKPLARTIAKDNVERNNHWLIRLEITRPGERNRSRPMR